MKSIKWTAGTLAVFFIVFSSCFAAYATPDDESLAERDEDTIAYQEDVIDEALPRETLAEQATAPLVSVPIIEEDPEPEPSGGPLGIVILFVPVLLGGLAGWFIRGFVDKKRGFVIDYDEQDDEDDEDEVIDEEDTLEDPIEEEVDAGFEPTPLPRLTKKDLANVEREPDGFDELQRPYWYDEVGQPYRIDTKTGEPLYYYTE